MMASTRILLKVFFVYVYNIHHHHWCCHNLIKIIEHGLSKKVGVLEVYRYLIARKTSSSK
jgi:hypothetical protein